jgi:hypothetical protein
MYAWFMNLFLGLGRRDCPSLWWRISWLLFCGWLLRQDDGLRRLQQAAPYVLAGVGESPTKPLLPQFQGDLTYAAEIGTSAGRVRTRGRRSRAKQGRPDAARRH